MLNGPANQEDDHTLRMALHSESNLKQSAHAVDINDCESPDTVSIAKHRHSNTLNLNHQMISTELEDNDLTVNKRESLQQPGDL